MIKNNKSESHLFYVLSLKINFLEQIFYLLKSSLVPTKVNIWSKTPKT